MSNENSKDNVLDNENKNPKESKNSSNNGSKHHKRGTPKRQDPFWYAQSQEAINRCGNIPWNTICGSPLPGKASNDSVPSILVIPSVHCISATTTIDDAEYAKRTADAFFQYICQGYIGNITDFEAPDLLFTALAGSDLAAFIEEVRRGVSILNTYMPQNKAYAKHIFRALGFDFDAFVSSDYSLADFIADLNIRIEQFNTIVAVPRSFMISERWNYLASWLFTDNNQAEFNTLCAYRMAGVLKYSGTSVDTGTSLVFEKLYDVENPDVESGLTPRSVINKIDILLEALTGDDPRFMFAAIRRVYDASQLRKIESVVPGVRNIIVRNDIISCAIHNGTYFNYIGTKCPHATDEFDILGQDRVIIYQENGDIEFRPYAAADMGMPGAGIWHYPDDDMLIDTWAISPTPGNVLDMTASMVAYGNLAEEKYSTIFQSILPRCEINYLPELWFFEYDADGSNPSFTVARIQLEQQSTMLYLSEDELRFSHINSAPFIKLLGTGNGMPAHGNFPAHAVKARLGEIDKYTIISSSVLHRIHARSMYTLLMLPKNDKSITKR